MRKQRRDRTLTRPTSLAKAAATLLTVGLMASLSAVPTNAVPTNAVPTNAVPTNAVPTNAVPTRAGAQVAARQNVTGALDWERTNPGGGGTIATVGATASGTLITAADLSGAYRSFDNGNSWEPLGSNQGLAQTHTTSLGFHPTNGNTFFVGTGWGIYKTTNSGDTFSEVLDNGYIEGFSFPPANSQVGYVAYHEDWDTAGEVYKTTDGGDTWGAVAGENLPDIRIVKVLAHPLDANVVYALGGKSRWGCSQALLYRSGDGGTTWARVGSEFSAVLDFDVDPTNTKTVFVSTFEVNACATNQVLEEYLVDDYEAGAFYRSTNSGSSWTELSTQTGIISVSDDAKTIRIMTVLFPYDWNDDAGTWQSDDSGANWRQTGHVTDWNQGWITNQYFAYSASFNGFNKTITKDIFQPDRFYASFGSWAWASSEEGAVLSNISTREVSPGKFQSTGMENIVGHGLAVSESNPDVIYMGAYDIGMWTSLDRGRSWQRTLPDHNKFEKYVWSEGQGSNVTALVADPSIDGVVWAVFHREGFGNGPAGDGTNSALFKSTDYGQTWAKISNGLPDARFFYGLTLDPKSAAGNRTMFMTVEGDVYKSTNDGNSWAKVLSQGGLKFTAVDAEDSSLVYAGGEAGLWRSTDGGANWSEVGLAAMHGAVAGNFLPTDAGWEGVFDVVADPTVAGRIYVVVYGSGKGLYRSDDRGDTWEQIYRNNHMRGVAVSEADPSLVFATSSDSYHSGGTDFDGSAGIVFSTDGGQSWINAADDMAWPYGGRVRIAGGSNPYVIAWAPGTGLQMADLAGIGSPSDGPTYDNCRQSPVNPSFGTTQETPGSVYRLYCSYFLRYPDNDGFNYWNQTHNDGTMNLEEISNFFANSDEFDAMYGSLSNSEFVSLIYVNIMERAAEPEGFNFWLARLDDGSWTQGRVMLFFSQSDEFRAKTGTGT